MIKNFSDNTRKIKVILVILLILLIPVGIIAAENITNDNSNSPDSENPSIIPTDSEISDIIISENQETTPLENISIIPEIIETIETNETLETDEIFLEENATDEENINNSLSENLTIQENLTENNSPSEILTDSTMTGDLILENPQTETNGSAELKLELIYPDKITRGKNIEIKAIIFNKGNIEAKNIIIEWQLPQEFEIISQSQDSINLSPQNSFESVLIIKTSDYSLLGKNQIKISVSYE